MKIKDIKSKEVREEAERLAVNNHGLIPPNSISNLTLDDAFDWGASRQGFVFWNNLVLGEIENYEFLDLPNATWEESLNFTGEIEANPATPESVQPDNKYLQVSTISMRDYFAVQAMKGILHSDYGAKTDLIAKWAYEFADEMIKASKK